MSFAPEKVREIVKIRQHPVSFETPLTEGGDTQLGDLIEDTAIEKP